MKKTVTLLLLCVTTLAHAQDTFRPIDLNLMVSEVDAISTKTELSTELLATKVPGKERVKMEKEMDELRGTISRDRTNGALFVRRGVLRKQLSMWLDATADLEKALKVDPNQHEAHYYLSEVWMMYGSRYNALTEIELYIKQCPDSAKGYYQKGLVLTLLPRSKVQTFKQRAEEAVPELDKVLTIDPNHRDALIVRGCVGLFLHANDLAIADFSKVLASNANDGLAHFLIGNVYEEKADAANACTNYTAAQTAGLKVPDRIMKRSCPK